MPGLYRVHGLCVSSYYSTPHRYDVMQGVNPYNKSSPMPHQTRREESEEQRREGEGSQGGREGSQLAITPGRCGTHSWGFMCHHEQKSMRCGNPGIENGSHGPIPIPSPTGTHLETVALAPPTTPGAHLQVVGGDDWSLPWTPHILLQLPQDLKASPAAAPILIQLLKQHLFCLGETQLPVITGPGHQVEPK